MQTRKIIFMFFVLLSLISCVSVSTQEKSINIQVSEPVIDLVLGEQLNWEGLYTATNQSGEDLTALVERSINDTTSLSIGHHQVQLSLRSENLQTTNSLTINVVLTHENILFSLPEDELAFSVGEDISTYDFGVTAHTESGKDITEYVETILFNEKSLQMGLHEALFRILVSEDTYVMTRINFTVQDEAGHVEFLNVYNGMTIEQYDVVDGKAYILGYSEENLEMYREFIIFDFESESLSRLTEWGGNLHGNGEQPQGMWKAFSFYQEQIYLLGYEAYLIDETQSGTDQFEYHIMLSIYNMDLTLDSKVELLGTTIDIPTNIAINDNGEIAISGYSHGSYHTCPIAIYDQEYELLRLDTSNAFSDMIADGNNFIIVGYESTSPYSSGFDGFVIEFNANGTVWQYKEKGYDMDTFIKITKTEDGYLVLGETESYHSDEPYNGYIAYTVLLDDQGNLLEKHYYTEVSFPYKSFFQSNNVTYLLGYDVVSYFDYTTGEINEHRIPSIFLYDSNDELVSNYDIYVEQYVIFEQSIMMPYDGGLYALVDLGYIQISSEDIPEYMRGLFLVKISE